MTIYDIAKLAGVSKSTVSRVINNDPKVSDDVRKKVESVIKEKNYRPNKNARALNGKSLKTILIIMTRLNSYAENRALSGFVSELNNECEFMIFESNFSMDETKRIIDKHQDVDGILIFAIGNGDYKEIIVPDKPLVFIGQNMNEYKSVSYQDYEAVRIVLESSVKKRNASNLLYVGVDTSDPTTGKLRQTAFEDYCVQNSLTYKTVTTSFDSLNSFKLIHNHQLESVDLIMCATDRIALGVYKEILLKDLSNIKLVAVGNNKQVNFIIDDFTTVDLNYTKSGKQAASLLFQEQITQQVVKASIVE